VSVNMSDHQPDRPEADGEENATRRFVLPRYTVFARVEAGTARARTEAQVSSSGYRNMVPPICIRVEHLTAIGHFTNKSEKRFAGHTHSHCADLLQPE